ncbi:chemotaxis protein CheX [Mobilisporobacter senegalensis]|uniref:Chemotaxis protein CheX n=1 Tax=Mobilisporobacter senegalensis TaxID=1329262 RepID=A0A3N1X570_9FIRM|nr:chemotaxis protein CheX [Mobilisporobacter senegalensis]ROR21934.1 chemotaxis protein CheX [Mobilisporobacter senegalensis]
MADMSADFINPFLVAATKILKDMVMIDAKVGKPFVKTSEFREDSVVIIIGVTGEARGQVMIAFEKNVACDIVSKMIMMPVAVLDELGNSAICELGNMILGNAATVFSTKGILIDITPPTLAEGNMVFTNNFTKNISVPLIYDNNKMIEVNIAIKGD